MPIHVDEMNMEVIAEAPGALAGADATPPADRDEELARVRFALACAERLAQRLRAEGCDD
jgi:hypothetical protein